MAKKFPCNDTFNENIFVDCIFNGENSNVEQVKRSSSFKAIDKDNIKNNEDSKRIINDCNLEKKEADNDLRILDKLSLINMEARYELLNTNRMMVDLDMELVSIMLRIEYARDENF